ncbi:MAG TPA: DUF58 domain-containing protein [Coleofasciculaceae cyanobacterium]
MAGLAIFFFAAATNTMSGWLYVMSGVMLALLVLAAVLPQRSLRNIQVHREAIAPVSVGEPLTVEVGLENRSHQPKTLLLVQDLLPAELGAVRQAIEQIPAGQTYRWHYQQPTEKRGVYRWQTVQLRTAAPLGLFWCQRTRTAAAKAIVYPTVLPLSHCPLIDGMGLEPTNQRLSDRQAYAATEGLTRTLRPYRWGDSMRLIHWRTSARYGELRVRELETYTGGQSIVIALDSGEIWQPEAFEQAVVAAASLYFYARHQGMTGSLWTAATGQIQGDLRVLETLAETGSREQKRDRLPNVPMVWLTPNPLTLVTLPAGSRWLLWQSTYASTSPPSSLDSSGRQSSSLGSAGLTLHPEQTLQTLQIQLQAPLTPSSPPTP